MRRQQLYDEIPNDYAAIQWARDKGILLKDPLCTLCGTRMLEVSSNCVDRVTWQCRMMIDGIRHKRKV